MAAINFTSSSKFVDTVYGLLSTLTVKRYQHTKPSNAKDSEYIVINALPVPAGVMQVGYVNVNYFVKDINPGVPDITKLQAGEERVIALLKKVTASDKTYMIDIESQETFREESAGEHYSNLRFSFKFINYQTPPVQIPWDVDSINVDINDER